MKRRRKLIEQFVEEGWPRSTAMFNTYHPEDAEQALQDAVVYALDKMPTGSTEHAIGWFSLCVKHLCWKYNSARTRNKERLVDHRNDVTTFGPSSSSVEESALNAVVIGSVFDALTELKTDERLAFLDFELRGLSYKDIASERGWSLRKVDRCITEGRAALRDKLALTHG